MKTYLCFGRYESVVESSPEGCYLGAERRERGAGGRNFKRKKVSLAE